MELNITTNLALECKGKVEAYSSGDYMPIKEPRFDTYAEAFQNELNLRINEVYLEESWVVG